MVVVVAAAALVFGCFSFTFVVNALPVQEGCFWYVNIQHDEKLLHWRLFPLKSE